RPGGWLYRDADPALGGRGHRRPDRAARADRAPSAQSAEALPGGDFVPAARAGGADLPAAAREVPRAAPHRRVLCPEHLPRRIPDQPERPADADELYPRRHPRRLRTGLEAALRHPRLSGPAAALAAARLPNRGG